MTADWHFNIDGYRKLTGILLILLSKTVQRIIRYMQKENTKLYLFKKVGLYIIFGRRTSIL